tara:strand:- start:51 stop:2846 length:2796 start_codon:yes stop_codon:yes gene_type:complete
MAFLPENTGKVIWVDSVNGNNSIAEINRPNLPYLTVGAALSASTSGDTITVRPGVYLEENLNIPTNVSLISEGGWQVTRLGKTPSSASSNVVILNQDSYINGFGINIPEGSFSGIYAPNSGGTNGAYNITFYGNETTGSSGIGLNKTGGGKIIGAEIRCEAAGLDTLMKVDSGTIAIESTHVPQSNGSINNVIHVTTDGSTGAGRAQMVNFNTGNDNVINATRVDGGTSGNTPSCLVFTANIFNASNAISTNGDYHTVNYLGGRIENVDYAVNVDLSGTGVSAVFRITSNHQPNYIYPPSVAYLADFGLDFSQEETDRFLSSKNIYGLDRMSVGLSERGTQSFLGKGAPYTTGMVVLTTDNTTSSVSDGGGFIDVSEEAKSSKNSVFTFQTGGTGTSILITTTRVSSDLSSTLKFFGLDMDILSKAEGGSYVFEFWNGSSWVEDLYQVSSEDFGYNYGKTLFLRNQSQEHVFLGLDKDIDDNWSAKTINGTTGYWVRCRMASSASTRPYIEQINIAEDSTHITREGVLQFGGRALYKESHDLVGGQWGIGQGTLTDLTVTVGSGTNPTQTWSHEFRTSKFSSNGEAATFTMKIPKGVSTAQKINVFADYILDQSAADTTPAQMIFSLLPVQVANVLVADPDGAKEPKPRSSTATTEFDTYTAQTNNITTDVGSKKVHTMNLGSYDISDYYSDDMLYMRLEMDDGPSVDFNLLNLYVDFDKWTLGSQANPAKLEVETIFTEDFSDKGVSNGWVTVQNPAEDNLWTISTGTSRSNIYSAHVTDDLGTTDIYEYTVNNTQSGAHLYVDFSIPGNARTLTINFYWTCLGENGSSSSNYDYGRVGLAPTTYTPSVGSEFTSAYRIGASSNDEKFNVGYNGGAAAGAWTLETISVPTGLWTAGTDARLILQWKNDGSIGAQPPFAVDDISIEVESIK